MNTFNGYFTERDDILFNKLGISDPAEMKQIEAEVVPLRIAELLSSPPEGDMDYAYLCRVHEQMFGDLYPMAGKSRDVDIAKGTSAFCYAQFIDDEQRRIFRQLKHKLSVRLDTPAQVADLLAWLASELNALHPFREGNGRAIRTFMILFAERLSIHLDYARVSEEIRMQADIEAFHGNMALLRRVYHDMIDTD